MDINTDEAFNSFLPGAKQDDSSCVVRFYLKPKLMAAKSRDAGREIYEDREHCEIMVKGQPHQIVDEEVGKQHIDRFPNAYAAFKAGRPDPVTGTPIELLPNMSPSYVLTLKAMGIRTVEDMVNLSDAGLQKVGMGARDLQNRCRAFIGQSTTKADELERENHKLKSDVATLSDAVSKLQETIAAMTAPKKRGRPSKQQTDASLQ